MLRILRSRRGQPRCINSPIRNKPLPAHIPRSNCILLVTSEGCVRASWMRICMAAGALSVSSSAVIALCSSRSSRVVCRAPPSNDTAQTVESPLPPPGGLWCRHGEVAMGCEAMGNGRALRNRSCNSTAACPNRRDTPFSYLGCVLQGLALQELTLSPSSPPSSPPRLTLACCNRVRRERSAWLTARVASCSSFMNTKSNCMRPNAICPPSAAPSHTM
mmetsp:Transcript_48466/g.78107  ORF Transcript_48466/g.78107 Transcript_48466/m.78107 type:complete len:218 (-) Transcript_48466:81-734(-)